MTVEIVIYGTDEAVLARAVMPVFRVSTGVAFRLFPKAAVMTCAQREGTVGRIVARAAWGEQFELGTDARGKSVDVGDRIRLNTPGCALLSLEDGEAGGVS